MTERDLRHRAAATVLLGDAAAAALVLLPLLRADGETRAALGPALALAFVALGTAAAVTSLALLVVPSLAAGGRRAVVPAMLAGSALGAGAVLIVPPVVDAVTGPGLLPSAALLTYVTAAAASLGVAQILALHRFARVGGHGCRRGGPGVADGRGG